MRLQWGTPGMRSRDVPVHHNAETRLQAVRASAQVNMCNQLVVGAHGVIPKCRVSFRTARKGTHSLCGSSKKQCSAPNGI
jgi:hypothetical protein